MIEDMLSAAISHSVHSCCCAWVPQTTDDDWVQTDHKTRLHVVPCFYADCCVNVMPVNPDLNVALEGHKTTSAGRLFHILLAAGKKFYLNALMEPLEPGIYDYVLWCCECLEWARSMKQMTENNTRSYWTSLNFDAAAVQQSTVHLHHSLCPAGIHCNQTNKSTYVWCTHKPVFYITNDITRVTT